MRIRTFLFGLCILTVVCGGEKSAQAITYSDAGRTYDVRDSGWRPAYEKTKIQLREPLGCAPQIPYGFVDVRREPPQNTFEGLVLVAGAESGPRPDNALAVDKDPREMLESLLYWLGLVLALIIAVTAILTVRKTRLWRTLLRKTNQMDLLFINLKRGYVTSFLHFSLFAGHLPQASSLHLDHWAQFFKIPIPGHYLAGAEALMGQKKRNWKAQPFQSTLSHGQGAHKSWYQEDGTWITNTILQVNLFDITSQKKKALELEAFMGIDPVTELYDRRVLRDKLKELLAQYPSDEAVMCFITLSDFEKFQEQYGLEAANMMLLEAGRTLRTLAPSRSAHFHIVKGEFCLCVAGVDAGSPWSDPDAMLHSLQFEIRWEGQCLSLDSACGYSLYPLHADTVEGLVERANFTMKMARQDPVHPVQRYNEEYFHSHRNFRFRLQEYNNVVEHRQITPVFQPIYNLDTGALFGYEALSRVCNPSFSNILQLLEVSELKGDLYRLNLLLLEEIISQYPWQDYPGIRLFFNFDIGSVANMEHFASRIHSLFTRIQFANSAIEITERHSTKDQMGLFDVIRRFREGGSIVVIDDYGTGYSNESSLVRIQPDIVKLDREMVRDIESDAYKQHFVAQFMDFSRQTGMKVLGEGIETEAEKRTLMELGVHFGQGYYLGRPMKLEPLSGGVTVPH